MNFQSLYTYIPSFVAIILLTILTIKFILPNQTTRKKKPLLYSTSFLILLLLLGLSFILARSLLADYYFAKSLNSDTVNQVYEFQRKAIIINPNKDEYRIRFSQTNLLIANGVLNKSLQQGNELTSQPANILSAEDRQTATKAVQASIEEAKAAVKLNDKKASNWANLANIYKNLLNFAEDADRWSISAYQRAIILDSKNPDYHLELGGVYYLLKNYDQAEKKFAEAIKLNPTKPNAYYNLAWTYFQKGEMTKAISNLETTISLLNNKDDSRELSRTKKDLELFKSQKR